MAASEAYDFDAFIAEVTAITHDGKDEHAVTAAVAAALTRLLAQPDFRVPAEMTVPDEERYVMYPLYVAPDGSFSVASAVWNVGQDTPVHGHETWGVVGIYQGVEVEDSYEKPAPGHAGPLAVANRGLRWGPGQVTVCCTTDDDVHRVACGSDVPCIGIHVYGADIGRLPRRRYNAVTGQADWFVSPWAGPSASGDCNGVS